ncbi:Hermansky-Pudlak syndrome 4 protein isoform X2 [Amblyomma americanum]
MIAAAFVIWFAASTALDWASGYLSALSDYLGAAATMTQRREAVVAPAPRKLEDAVAAIAVPWKWDILHRWKPGRRMEPSGSPATADLLQTHKVTGEEHSLGDRLLIVYDRDLCIKEEDDPNDAIVFFHPADVPTAQKCELSCQLVGVVHFFDSCFDTPRAVELWNTRVAIRVLANYVVVLGGTKNLADYILQQQADMLLRLLRFYHKSFPDMIQGYSGGEPFAARVREFCNSCLPVCCGPKDQLSNLFMAVPTLKLPDAASNVYTKGFALLEGLQKMPGVLASCVLFDERVLASQFTPEITHLLLLAATSKNRLSMQDVPVKYPIPPAVRLVNVYLETPWLRDLAVINKQSNESPKELDKYVEGPVDDRKLSTGSLHSIQDPDGQHAEKYPPAQEDKDKEMERADSLSDVDSTMSSQETNRSSSCAPLIPAVLQATGKQSLPDSDFLSDFDSAEDTDFTGPYASLKRLTELQDTVADCLRISQENLATDKRRRRRAASRKSKRDLRKYVSKPDLRSILRDIDEAQGQECQESRVSAGAYRCDDTNIFQDYDAGIGFDAAGLFYQAQMMHTPSLLSHHNSQRSKVTTMSKQVTTRQPQSQLLYDLYTKKFQRALTKFGEMCSSLGRSKERSVKQGLFSSLRNTCESRPEPEVTDAQELLRQDNGFELPPVVQVELGEALDVPIEETNPVYRKREAGDGAGSPQPNGAPAQEQPKHESERLCSADSRDQRSVTEGDTSRTGAQCELRRSTLFIQRYCNMACLVLLSDAAEENEHFIYSLWKRCIAELGDLEVAARSWQHQDSQPTNGTKGAEVCFNSKLCSLRGTLDAQEEVKKQHIQLIQSAHGEFLRSSSINNINALSLGKTWIQATRSEDHESFKVMTDDKDFLLTPTV